jgi:putative NADPH-quinone reductase
MVFIFFMSKTVIFFAHPNINASRINKTLIEEAKKTNVLIRDLYPLYGNTKFNEHIDAKEDQKIIENAERIILQFPFHWYSVPALLKQWIDDVLAYGWAFGIPETKLKGKKLYLAITTGGEERAYRPNGPNLHFPTDFLHPLIQTAKTCQMDFAGIFFVHGAGVITDAELKEKSKEYFHFING